MDKNNFRYFDSHPITQAAIQVKVTTYFSPFQKVVSI